MLPIEIPEREMWDEINEVFIQIPRTTLKLEHSLVSISKWEAKYKRPFISKNKNDVKTREETIDYIRFMTLTQNVNPVVYYGLTNENLQAIADYVDDPMTASWVNEEDDGKKSNEAITSELIYWWMTALQIPWEAQKWHLNRLMMLIRIGNEKSKPPKKRSRAEILARNKRLNEERRRRLNTKG